MPKWKRDATEFTVGVNHHKVRGYQTSIPKPVMEKLNYPEKITFVVTDDGTIIIEGTPKKQAVDEKDG